MAAHRRGLGTSRYLVLVFLAVLSPDLVHGVSEYEVGPFCTSPTYIDLSYQDSVLVTLDWVSYTILMDCRMEITAPSDKRIAVKFLSLDVHCSDSLTLYDGVNEFSPLLGSYCGSSLYHSDVETSGNDLYLQFRSDISNDGQGFKLLITAFHTDYCDTSGYNFKCDNGRCIDYSLYCNDYDNCGDDSDHCYRDYNWWIWMVVGIVVFLVICAIITVICCCACKKNRPGQVVRTAPGLAVQYNAGMQTTVTTTPGVNPWYGPQPTQPQYQPQYQTQYQPQTAYPPAYPPPQGGTQPPPFSALPPAYTSVSGAPVYPTGSVQPTPVGPSAPGPDPLLVAEKPAL